MNKSLIIGLVAALGCVNGLAQAELVTTHAQSCPKVPDKIGFAGMAAGLIPARGATSDYILFVGGANFPFAQPDAKTAEERGAKVFHKQVGMMSVASSCSGCSMAPAWVGNLPYGIGYCAFVTTNKALIIAGGANEKGHTDKVNQLWVEGGSLRIEALPELPITLAYPAFAKIDSKFYVFGGQEKDTDTTCTGASFVLDLDETAKGWQKLPDMPSPRMLAGAAVHKGYIYIMGGCSLAPDAKGAGERTYLKDVLIYDPDTKTWGVDKVPAMPETMVASPNPFPVVDGKAYVLGGDPGNYYRASIAGNPPADHPGQSNTVYTYNFAERTWATEGTTPLGVATAPAVQTGKTSPASIMIISGETHPGVRTPGIGTMEVHEDPAPQPAE
ncbi:MAG: kelch repeat-containing protein [Akkermansia sp.]